ncbi:hypothetical protein ACGFX4_29635 [Kitasatospora sp. NPDC048365]|uniref:hypothetical protein n=1 Tax=Kitasatospora sp. NPDC048365 TaxID=3364050 RepID=UPI0037196746
MARRGPKAEQAYRERLAGWVRLPEAYLEPGERLFGVCDLGLDRYVRRELPRRYRVEKPPVPGREQARAKEGRGCLTVLLLPFQLLDVAGWVEELGDALFEKTFKGIRRAFHGRPFVGGWGSSAGRFAIAVRTGPLRHRAFRHNRALLAVTDRRVLLVDHDNGELMAAFGRAELHRTGVRRSRQPERVDLVFADGSLLAVVADSPADAEALSALVRG